MGWFLSIACSEVVGVRAILSYLFCEVDFCSELSLSIFLEMVMLVSLLGFALGGREHGTEVRLLLSYRRWRDSVLQMR